MLFGRQGREKQQREAKQWTLTDYQNVEKRIEEIVSKQSTYSKYFLKDKSNRTVCIKKSFTITNCFV